MSEQSNTTELIYSFVKDYLQERQISPSMREIADACALALSTVSYHLDSLEAQGRIQRSRFKSRTLHLGETERVLDEVAQEVYEFLVAYIYQEKVSPTQGEIAEACHLSKTGVRLQLKRLEGAGRIQRGLGHRNIQLTDVRE